MKYTSRELVDRALHLADIANTSFLSHKECTQYINDAWTSVFQWLINKGDTQFVKEVDLMNGYGGTNDYTEYELPEDLYQIKSVKNKYTGSIVTRHAESEGINSNSYDVVNDKLRLYGVSQNPLLLTYYAVPTFISFPDLDIEVTLPADYNVVSAAKNSVLLRKNTEENTLFIIKNIKTDETISTFALDPNLVGTFVLGNGHVVQNYTTGITYYDFNGNVVYEGTDLAVGNTFHDEDYNVYYQNYDSETGYYSVPKLMGTTADIDNENKKVLFYFYDHIVYDLSDLNTARIEVDDWDTIELPFTPSGDYDVADLFDGKDSFILTDSHHNIYRFVIESDHLELYQLNIRAPLFYAITEYGILTGNGTEYTLKSSIPDTEMNFPNELYFSMIACDLAVRFAMKQNADIAGLQGLYDSMKYTFMDSLSQNADYTRIRNVYK